MEPGRTPGTGSALVEAVDLVREYQMGEERVRALDGLNLSIDGGQFVSVVGPSGAGKSTLLHVLGALDTPTSGRISIDGVDLGALDDTAASEFRRNRVGFIFQFFNLIPVLSARENVALPLLLTHLDRDLYHLGPKPYTDDFQQCWAFFENSVPTQPIPVLDPQQRQFVVSVLERISQDFKSNKKRYARLYAKKNYSPERAYWEARTRMLDYIIPEIRADNLKGILKSSDLSMLMLREGGPYPSPHKPAPPDESADNVFPPMTEREAYDKLLYFVSIDFPDQPLLDSWALLVSPRSPHNVIGPIAMRYNRAFLDIPDPLSDRRFMLVYMYIHLLSLNHVDATTIDTTAAEPRLVSFVRKREANPVSLITPTGTASGSNSSGSTTSVRTCLIQYLPRITQDISTRTFLDPATKDLRSSILRTADLRIAAFSRVPTFAPSSFLILAPWSIFMPMRSRPTPPIPTSGFPSRSHITASSNTSMISSLQAESTPPSPATALKPFFPIRNSAPSSCFLSARDGEGGRRQPGPC